MALLGDSINPALMVGDYSGFANAAQIQAAGLTNMGNQIGGAIRDQADQQKEAKKISMASAKQIKAAMDLFPNAKGALEPIYNELRNEDIPISERAAIGAAAPSILNMVIDRETGKEDMALKIRALSGQEKAAEQDFRMNEFKLADAERSTAREIKAAELDDAVKSQVGPQMLDQVKGLLGPGYEGVSASDPAQAFEMAKQLGSLVPKEKAKAFEIKDISNSDGSKTSYLFDTKSGDITSLASGGASLDAAKLPAPLKGYAGTFSAMGQKYGVDPKVLAAISMHETGNGTSSAFKDKNNAMGVSDASGPVDTGTVENSIERMAKLLAAGQRGEGPYAGKATIPDIAGVYAPVGAGNDPRGLNSAWTGGVSKYLTQLGGNPSASILLPPQAGVTPAPNQQPSVSEQIAVANFNQENSQKATEREIGELAKVRSLKAIDKFIDSSGKPTAALEDATGFGEGVGSWWGNVPFLPGGNSPQAMSDQKELAQEYLEGSVLEAAKYLKPVSNDEMKMLLKNRPAVTDHPTVWADYLNKIKTKLSDPANYKDGKIPTDLVPNADPAADASNRIRASYGK